MLFTRTIRRKMMFGLALILVMLVTLSLSGASGLQAYRELIDEFRFSMHEAPRQSELVKAVGQLFEPLALDFPDENEARALVQQKEFRRRLQVAREKIRSFHDKLNNLPPTPAVLARRPVTETFLVDLEERLDRLEEQLSSLGDPDLRRATAHAILQELVQLQATAQKAPDHHEGIHSALNEADRVFRHRLLLILWATGVVVVLFLGLVRYGYTGVVVPLRTLHQGAQRVAQGDFDYRVDIHTKDEVAELANAFNRMTARFQEITRDLDRQVRERSKQLVRSDRLAGLGQFAAGIAHEINNPLSAIATAAEALEYRRYEAELQNKSLAVSPNPTAESSSAETDRGITDVRSERVESEPKAGSSESYLRIIQNEAFRCQEITRKILDFARGQDAPRIHCDLTNIVCEVQSLVELMSKYRGRSIEFSHSRPCEVEINGAEIKQVVLNLVTNALESMDRGGMLRIHLTEETDQVYVTLEDDGCGMTPEVVENLFEPFFTRRKDGRGTGLGMSISNRIIADHGGTIEASSDGPGCGSTFVIQLPRTASRPEAAA